MKSLFILFGFFTLQTCNQSKSEQKLEVNTSIEYRELANVETERDTILNNIQEKITVASYDGFAKRNTQKLDEVESFLEKSKVENIELKNYWIAYVNYYKTIIAMLLKNKDLGAESNRKGIELLESNKNKNSDDYALLVLLKGMSYSFVSGMEAPGISKSIKTLIEKGIKSDDTNFRIYYAQGSVDFYTPKEFGGGTKTESALLKAINLPEKNKGYSQLPTWGKEESYDLIIRFYLRENLKEKAKTYFDEAKQLFPNSYIIHKHQSNFK